MAYRALAVCAAFSLVAAQRPMPSENPCVKELMEHCKAEHAAVRTGGKAAIEKCDKCVKRVPLGPKTDGNCTEREELAFCEPLRPAAAGCLRDLEKLCAEDRHNRTACDRCVRKNVKPAFNCSTRQELEFCELGPAPSWECERDLRNDCSKARAEGEKVCDECVQKIATKDKNCTKREELTFCNRTHPPEPGPISRECEAELSKVCSKSRVEGQKECDECVKKVGPEEHCTLREELSFCNATKPEPIQDECESVLKADCSESKRDGQEACDSCVEKIAKEKPTIKCSRKDELAFCGGAPKPGPISRQCEKLLKADCPTKPEVQCDKCTEAKGEQANCTKREEITFCNPPHKPPRPTPTPAECTTHLREICGKKKTTAECIDCAEEIGKEHGCTAASEKAACEPKN